MTIVRTLTIGLVNTLFSYEPGAAEELRVTSLFNKDHVMSVVPGGLSRYSRDIEVKAMGMLARGEFAVFIL